MGKLERVVDSHAEAEELLQIEEADAWFEYLESIRNLSCAEPRYAEVEPWAWARFRSACARSARDARSCERPDYVPLLGWSSKFDHEYPRLRAARTAPHRG